MTITAPNGRFGAMAAVSPQTILWEIGRYSPAGSSVEAATAPSRWDVRCKRTTARWSVTQKRLSVEYIATMLLKFVTEKKIGIKRGVDNLLKKRARPAKPY